jgi:hypothetical protein
MSAVLSELEEARPDLEDLLVEVLGTVFADEAYAVDPEPFPGDGTEPSVAVSRLEIHDPGDETYTVIEVRLGLDSAVALASRMFQLADPEGDDLLDAVGELGNIAAGNVKSLLRQTSQLSLPSARLAPSTAGVAEAVRVAAMVQGHLVQLGVFPADKTEGVLWPGNTP